MKSTGTELILQHYLDWQKAEKQKKTLKEFSVFCGINESYLNLVMNGKRPLTEKLAIRFAKLFDDPRFYEIMDLPTPDPDLQIITESWPYIPKDMHHVIRQQVENYIAENNDEENPVPNHKRSKPSHHL